MKSIVKWILTVLVLTALFVGAMVLYENLSDRYYNGGVMESPKEEDGAEGNFAAPDFEVLDPNGEKVRLSDFKGKPVVLNFWATWCGYCKEEMPDFDKASKEYPDVQFMMINATDGVQETIDSAKIYIDNSGFSFDVFFDTKMDASRKYYVSGLPATFFINEEGELVAQGKGMLDYESLVKGIEMIQ
ncbi:MAG: TlpA family protein disulfide reductase [Clostridia bacterium]|nr:TlpA family protein disulfide reductase [Clostridia bacterium]